MCPQVIADMTALSDLPALEAAEDAALNETDVSYFRWANMNRAATVSQVVWAFAVSWVYSSPFSYLSMHPSTYVSSKVCDCMYA